MDRPLNLTDKFSNSPLLKEYASLLVVVHVLEQVLQNFPEAKDAAINAVMEIATPQMVRQWHTALREERVLQHMQDCSTCCLFLNPIDCKTASVLYLALQRDRAGIGENL
jgi:hypothetical protein